MQIYSQKIKVIVPILSEKHTVPAKLKGPLDYWNQKCSFGLYLNIIMLLSKFEKWEIHCSFSKRPLDQKYPLLSGQSAPNPDISNLVYWDKKCPPKFETFFSSCSKIFLMIIGTLSDKRTRISSG